jgi:hypothetical protein
MTSEISQVNYAPLFSVTSVVDTLVFCHISCGLSSNTPALEQSIVMPLFPQTVADANKRLAHHQSTCALKRLFKNPPPAAKKMPRVSSSPHAHELLLLLQAL